MSETLSERALDYVREHILGGALAPGAIVNEVEIARHLSMSRGPVREALRRLEGRKLIVREPYQRARVVALGPSDIRDVFEVREGLEGTACRLATLAMTDAALDDLVAQVKSVRLGERARTAPVFDLHWEIAQACNNARLRDLLCGDLSDLLRLYRRHSGDTGRRGDANEEHWQIVSAMAGRNAELAESLMRSHIRRATLHLTALAESARD